MDGAKYKQRDGSDKKDMCADCIWSGRAQSVGIFKNHHLFLLSHISAILYQSVTSRLETPRYRDFSQFFESIGLGLENFGLKKSLGIGLKNIWSKKKVSVLVSKILVLKKSLGIGLDEFFWSRHSVTVNHKHVFLEQRCM